ncbi:MAG: nucleoside 2-deoxyribosyltransferase [Patescibacteria group bacterium]|nr:nucleoside 2-deoxyribosyltransferase [Patescibacteria group bacterium]
MKKPIAYLASPLGFSEIGKLFHNRMLIPLVIETGFEIRDPWTLTSNEFIDSALTLPYGQEKKEMWNRINSIMGHNNTIAIEESDIIIAILDGTDIDSGTAAEIGYGSAFKKPIFGYRNDFRLGGENEGSIINLQVEYFIYLNGGEIVTNLELLKIALTRYKDHLSKNYQN